jgi:hypothetical protein
MIAGSSSSDYYLDLHCEIDNDDKDGDTAAANARLIVASPDADRILRHLMDHLDNGSGSGAPSIAFDSLMPADNYDGSPDEQTLADAVREYFKKLNPIAPSPTE